MSLTTIGIELTNACNLRCKHCLRDFSSEEKYFSLPLLKKILKEAKKFRTSEISFTGGEPTLHPDFANIITEVVKAGYRYSMITNGIDLDKIFPVLLSTKDNINRIGVSLDGATEETNDFNRGRGSFRKTLRSITRLLNYEIPVMLQMSVGSFNRKEIEKMALFASHLGVNELFFAHILPSQGNSLSLDFKIRQEIEDVICRLMNELKLPIHLSVGHSVPSPFYTCVALSMQRINIDYNGYLTFCCQISNFKGIGSSKKLPDFIADLNRVSLRNGIKRLLKKIYNFQIDKLNNIIKHNGNLYFPCDYCIRYFNKGVEN